MTTSNSTPGSATEPEGNLTGVRVVELTDEQGEYAGRLFSGLGAEVIKVEPPGGNSTRKIGPFYEDVEDSERSLFFWHYNLGKKSVVLDLTNEADRQKFLALLATALIVWPRHRR